DVAGLDARDIRRTMPRFAPANYAANLALLEPYAAIARGLGCTMAQLAIAWVLARDANVIALPGTVNPEHLRENLGAAKVVPDAATMAELETLFPPDAIAGARYSDQSQSEVDTEVFA